MAIEVVMPQLGESVVEGTVTKWLKQINDEVQEFEPLVEINTDKVDTEVPSPASGTLIVLYVGEGETVQAGTVLAMIGEPGEDVPLPEDGREAAEPITDVPAAVVGDQAEPVVPDRSAPASPRKAGDLGFISPVVARIAAEHSLDLAMVSGSGRGGRITKKDVLAFLQTRESLPDVAPWEQPASGELFRPTEEVFAAAPETPAEEGAMATPGTVQELDPIRRTIAEHMVRSKHTSPHVTTVMEVDMSRVIAHRQAHKEAFRRDGVNLTFTAYMVAASVSALKAVPIVNSSRSDEGIRLHKQVNIGVAVSLGEKGLIVPIIKDADQLSLLAISRTVNDLAERARGGRLQTDEVQGGTFTITNHGVGGSLFATPIINQPQAAILGVGAIQKRVVVVEGRSAAGDATHSMAIRPMLYLTLTIDHRILDGAIGDLFLAKVVNRLQTWS